MKRMIRKLRSRRGETLTEVIVGVLIASLGLALLAGMITSSIRIIRTSTEKMASYYSHQSVNVEAQNEGGAAGTVTLFTGTDEATGKEVLLNRTEGADSVLTYRNDDAGNPVISYRMNLPETSGNE